MARGQGLKPGRSQLTWGYERARNAAKVLRWWTCSHKTYTYPEWWIHPQSLLLHIPGVVNFMIVLAATKLTTPGIVNLQPLCLHLSGVVNSQPGSLQNTERSLYTYKSLLMSLCNSLAKVTDVPVQLLCKSYWCPCATKEWFHMSSCPITELGNSGKCAAVWSNLGGPQPLCPRCLQVCCHVVSSRPLCPHCLQVWCSTTAPIQLGGLLPCWKWFENWAIVILLIYFIVSPQIGYSYIYWFTADLFYCLTSNRLFWYSLIYCWFILFSHLK